MTWHDSAQPGAQAARFTLSPTSAVPCCIHCRRLTSWWALCNPVGRVAALKAREPACCLRIARALLLVALTCRSLARSCDAKGVDMAHHSRTNGVAHGPAAGAGGGAGAGAAFGADTVSRHSGATGGPTIQMVGGLSASPPPEEVATPVVQVVEQDQGRRMLAKYVVCGHTALPVCRGATQAAASGGAQKLCRWHG